MPVTFFVTETSLNILSKLDVYFAVCAQIVFVNGFIWT